MALVSDVIYGVGLVVTSPIWVWRLARTGKWRTDWSARFGRCEAMEPGRTRVLIHAVSVGEVNAARGLVAEIETRWPDAVDVVISATTDTGVARARDLFEPPRRVVRYPLDFTRSVRRFLDAVRPGAVALMELEVWPQFVAECERRGVPVVVLNGRLSERSYKRYGWVRRLIAPSFARLAGVAAQEPAYAERFIGLGAHPERVSVSGNMKWDTAVIADDVDGSDELAEAMGIDRHKPLVVMGSSGPGEEAMAVQELDGLRVRDRDVQLLIAPRKPERFDEAAAAMGDAVRRTTWRNGRRREPDDSRLFLLDTIGELRKAYALADVVIIGRSFCPLYGSDMMEPIGLGKPTIVGPNVADFADVMARLLEGRGVRQVAGSDELRRAVTALLEGEAGSRMAERGRGVIRAQRGATARNLDVLESAMSDAGVDLSARQGRGGSSADASSRIST